MHIIRNANSLLHADSFAEYGALIWKVFKQAFGRNTWLPVAWSIPGKCTLLERQIIVWMQIFLQRLELEFASFISNKLGRTLEFLLHEVYLENAHYWKGKWTFACSLFAEIGALICKVYKQAIWRNTWLSLHDVYLENGHNLKGKLMFSCRSLCRNLSSNFQVL